MLTRRIAKLRRKAKCGPATRAALKCTAPRAPPPKWPKADALLVEIARMPNVAAAAKLRMVDLRNMRFLQGSGVRGIVQRSVHPLVEAPGSRVHAGTAKT